MNKFLNVIVCFGALFIGTLQANAQDFIEHTPRRSIDFVHSIGVNTHFGYTDTTYRNYEEILKPRLLELGVKHIRDNTYNPDVVKKYKDIGKYGVKLLLITHSDRVTEQAKTIGSVLWGVEAVNEPDNHNYEEGWVEYAHKEQRRLFNTVKQDPQLRHLPVLGPSLANIRDNPSVLGDISEWMDYGSMHPYATGQHPAKNWGWGLSMADALKEARKVSGEKPILVTECGYHNRIEQKGHLGVSEQAAAIYHPHLFFVYFNQGIQRSYKYELLDLKPDKQMNDMECHFGLVRCDGSVKPSFTALKNLLTLLNDESDKFKCKTLAYDIDSEQGEKIRSVLLQKSDGSWWLALMRDVDVFDHSRKQDIDVDPIKVNIRFPRKMDVESYIPNLSTIAKTKHKSTHNVEIMLDEYVQLLRISR